MDIGDRTSHTKENHKPNGRRFSCPGTAKLAPTALILDILPLARCPKPKQKDLRKFSFPKKAVRSLSREDRLGQLICGELRLKVTDPSGLGVETSVETLSQ